MFQLIQVKGNDAVSFLQGQLTQDVGELARHGSLPAAWCNPKGRVFCVTRMLDLGGAIGLVVPADLAQSVLERLTMYRLRARVDLGLAGPDWRSMAVAGEENLAALATHGLLPDNARDACHRAGGLVAVELGGAERCVELYGMQAAFGDRGLDPSHGFPSLMWRKARIDAGIPTVVAATSEKYTPHMLNLDLLGAVSFDKGCYTGQEVVARTEHLGRSKRRLMHYRVGGGTAAIGDKLVHDDRDVGEVVNAAAEDMLAIVPVELHDQTLMVNGHRASPVPLPYAV